VVAVEPQAALAGHLRRRFSGRPHVQVVQCALGRSPGAATLHKTPDLTEIASLREDFSRRSRFASAHDFFLSEMVDILTLDGLIARHGQPRFCKIDVEGYESAVLAGLNKALPSLSFEFNREFQDDTSRCLDWLGQLGPYCYNYSLGETYTLAEPRWLTSRELQAVLWLRPDPLLWGDIYARIAP
jgi:FkbM family methyltransferase